MEGKWAKIGCAVHSSNGREIREEKALDKWGGQMGYGRRLVATSEGGYWELMKRGGGQPGLLLLDSHVAAAEMR